MEKEFVEEKKEIMLLDENKIIEAKESITVDNIYNRVYIIRGQQVMLDYDLAKLYGYEVKTLNNLCLLINIYVRYICFKLLPFINDKVFEIFIRHKIFIECIYPLLNIFNLLLRFLLSI